MIQTVSATRISQPMRITKVITPKAPQSSPHQKVRICQLKCDSSQVPFASSRFT